MLISYGVTELGWYCSSELAYYVTYMNLMENIYKTKDEISKQCIGNTLEDMLAGLRTCNLMFQGIWGNGSER